MRELTAKEKLLVSGGSDTGTLDTVRAEPPDFPDPPDDTDPWEDPWDPPGGYGDGDGGGGGGGDDSTEAPDDHWVFSHMATITPDGKAVATQSWTYADIGLNLTLSESFNLADLTWAGLHAGGSFSYGGSTYSIGADTSQWTVTGLSASYAHDFGNGLTMTLGINYNASNGEYTGSVNFVIPTP